VYLKSTKNTPVAKFYSEHGFKIDSSEQEDQKLYQIELEDNALLWPTTIKRQN
jgi:predicted enzyme involved in methoxymalonyl-ACP biosynthesis